MRHATACCLSSPAFAVFCFALFGWCSFPPLPPLNSSPFLQHFHFHRIFMNSHSALCSTYFSGQQMHSPYFSCQHTKIERGREAERAALWTVGVAGGGGSKPGVGIMFSAFCCKEFFAQAINLMCVMCCSRHTRTHTHTHILRIPCTHTHTVCTHIRDKAVRNS